MFRNISHLLSPFHQYIPTESVEVPQIMDQATTNQKCPKHTTKALKAASSLDRPLFCRVPPNTHTAKPNEASCFPFLTAHCQFDFPHPHILISYFTLPTRFYPMQQQNHNFISPRHVTRHMSRDNRHVTWVQLLILLFIILFGLLSFSS